MGETKVAADGIVLREGELLLVRRKFPPYKGFWALPGGLLEYNESAEEACEREIKEETGLDVKTKGIAGVYSEPGRDSRGHVVSVAFFCRTTGGELRKRTKETLDAGFFSPERVRKMKLAFDHPRILREAGFL